MEQAFCRKQFLTISKTNMKKIAQLLLVLTVLGGGTAHSQILTGFGSAQFNPFNISTDFQPPWTGTVNTTSLIVTGVSNNSGGIYDVLTTPVDISGSTAYINLLGSLTSVPTYNNFYLTLYDSSFNSLTYNLQWNDFGSTPTLVSSPLASFSGVFDGIVTSWELTVAGGASDTVSFTFNSLISSATPVPEPSTWFLLAMGALLLGGVYPRKMRQS